MHFLLQTSSMHFYFSYFEGPQNAKIFGGCCEDTIGDNLLVSPKIYARLLRALDDHFVQLGSKLTKSRTPLAPAQVERETNSLTLRRLALGLSFALLV